MLHLLGKNNLEYFEIGIGFNYDYEFPYLHDHDFWEFVYTRQPLIHCINNQRYEIEPNSILIIKPTDCHSIKAVEPPINPNKEPTHLNLKISTEKLFELLSVFGASITKKINSIVFPIISVKGDELNFFNKNLNNIIWSQDDVYRCVIIKMVIMYICLKNFEKIFSIPSNAATEVPDEIKKIALKLGSPAYFTSNLTDIIADAKYSKMQLSRLFKKYFSKTMFEYFLNAKISYAQNKLTLTDASILNIANEIGFSLSHFDHVFRAFVGISPNEFRKLYGKINLTNDS